MVYGYENVLDTSADVLTENSIKRIGSHHVEVINQCTFENFQTLPDLNTRTGVKTTGVRHPYLEITNSIILGKIMHDHEFNSNLILDGNLYWQIEPAGFAFVYDGGSYADLEDWQLAFPGLDTNSIEGIDPQLDSNGVPQAVGQIGRASCRERV